MVREAVSRSTPAVYDVSPLRESEVDTFFDIDAAAFGAHMSKGFEDLVRKGMSFDRIAASREAGVAVGTAASEKSALTVPGLARVPAAMVVAVAVLPSHRRQGRLTSLMEYQLADLRARGEIAAALYASEGGIYGRYGYGPATFGSTYTIDKRVAQLAPSIGEVASGRVRLVKRAVAAEAFPAVYRDYATTRAGELDRAEVDFVTALGEPGAEELSRRFYALYEQDASIDGYVAYEIAPAEPTPHSPHRLVVHEICTLSPAAYAAIWGFMLGIDLTVELVASGRPVDEPIRWSLLEPRQLRCTFSGDRTWVRLVDVGSCLRARRYWSTGDLVIDVHDPFCRWNTGRYRLIVEDDSGAAEVTRTDAEADIELDVSSLASIYLGGVPALELAQAGRIRQLETGSVPLLGRMFANDRAPYCLTPF
ncbi:MAG: GNAT family N-acetyltransferase [Actinomycetota bacterium]|nr:GNAT family N-acetyltransferase [Actinomycetota bacterium]